MKQNILNRAGVAGAVVLLSLVFPTTSFSALTAFEVQNQYSGVAVSAKDKRTIDGFEKRAKAYSKLREQIEVKMPKLSKEATAEQIEAHKTAFQERVRAARSGAKQGAVFTPEASELIRAIIKDEFKGREKQELRKTVLVEAETKAVPLRVNFPYPESAELLEMPATLLLRLPQLPKQMRFRFVARNMLLVDRENGLIVDYMLNAVP